METCKIVEYLSKPIPSPEPEIFKNDIIEIINHENNKYYKIKVYKEFSDSIYQSLTYNSKMFLLMIKNNNISWHHLYFIIKIYSISGNQNLIIKSLNNVYNLTNLLY